LNRFRMNRSRLRLEPDAYRQLTRQILAPDGWRCQDCGMARDLQVHHIRSRGQLGDELFSQIATGFGEDAEFLACDVEWDVAEAALTCE
jgi:hypothetical protein